MPKPPKHLPPSSREILIIGLLIGGVVTLTFTPALYILFHALQWQRASVVLERVFFPAFCLTAAAVGLAYQRIRARRALLDAQEYEE